jgi:glucokinase
MGHDRRMFIAADVGGTNARFGLYDSHAEDTTPVRTATLATTAAADAGDLVAAFAGGDRFEALSLAVAGAVVDGRARGSNLPWDIHEQALRDRFACPVRLLNDLEAIANFVPHATTDELESLQAGTPVSGGPIGVIAPGTGLGEAMLFAGDGGYRAMPAEAGHIDFAPNDARQDAWLTHLRKRYGHVSLERACSGSSLPRMYEFMQAQSGLGADPDVAAQIATAADAAPLIAQAALADACPVCGATLEMFVDILAAAAGNLALQIVATGGIVLAGGIPPRILPALREPRFLRAFTHKGRFTHLAERIPVAVLLNENAGLTGAALMHLASRSD